MRFRDWTGLSIMTLALGLAGCSDDGAVQNFPPVDYGYLSPIHLNVGAITIEDSDPAAPGSLSAKAPTPPDSALKAMAQQRLVASGTSGQAQFIIKQAYIDRSGDHALTGAMDVQLNVADADNRHTGFVHARITHKFDAGDHDPASRAELYAMTNAMMQDMNVELEFQIHKKLMSWLTDATGTPLVNGSVQQQSLGAPGSVPATTPAPPAVSAQPSDTPMAATTASVPSTPDAIFPTGGDTDGVTTQTPAVAHSPQAGVLTLPSTTSSATH